MAGARAGILILLGLLASAAVLAALPADVASVRVAGLGLVWWYAVIAAPLLGTVVATVALLRARG